MALSYEYNEYLIFDGNFDPAFSVNLVRVYCRHSAERTYFTCVTPAPLSCPCSYRLLRRPAPARWTR